MRVLVTGRAGFIGSHLVEDLVSRGDIVTVLDNFSTGSRGNLVHLEDSITIVPGDIRSSDSLDAVFNIPFKQHYKVVFHLAAQTSVPFSVKNPLYDVDVNLTGTLRVLDRCLSQPGRPFFVFASSAAVYGPDVPIPTREDALPEPISPYGANKLAVEHALFGLRQRGDLSSVALRFSNVYGPRQTVEGEAGVVARFIDNALNQRPLTVFGNGEQTRDFIYVKDIVAGLLHVADRRLKGNFNASTNTATSVNDFIGELRKIDGSITVSNQLPRSGDILHSRLDNSKLVATGWNSATTFNEGLRKTYEHYQKNLS